MYSHTRVHILSHSDKSHTYTHTCTLHTLIPSQHYLHTHEPPCTLTYTHTHMHTLDTHILSHTQLYSYVHSTHSRTQHCRYTYTRTLAPTLPCTLHVLPHTLTQSMCTHMYSHSYLHTQVMCLYSHSHILVCTPLTPADPAARCCRAHHASQEGPLRHWAAQTITYRPQQDNEQSPK